MSTNNSTSFGNYQSVVLDRGANITVTTRTIKVTDNVYKTDNITSLGEGSIEIGRIHWIFIAFAFFLGLLALAIDESFIGWIIILAGVAGIVRNIYKPKHYGLLLVLNSGDKRLFITQDIQGMRNVIEQIYQLIEADKENMTYQITVENSRISGNLVAGDQITTGDITDSSGITMGRDANAQNI